MTKRVSDEKIKNAFLYILSKRVAESEDKWVLANEFLEDFHTLPPLLLSALLIELEEDELIRIVEDKIEVPYVDENGEEKTYETDANFITLPDGVSYHDNDSFSIEDFPAQVKECSDYLKVVLANMSNREYFMDEFSFSGYNRGFHSFAVEIAKDYSDIGELTINIENEDNTVGERYKFYFLNKDADKDYWKNAVKNPELCSVVEE